MRAHALSSRLAVGLLGTLKPQDGGVCRDHLGWAGPALGRWVDQDPPQSQNHSSVGPARGKGKRAGISLNAGARGSVPGTCLLRVVLPSHRHT